MPLNEVDRGISAVWSDIEVEENARVHLSIDFGNEDKQLFVG